MPSKRSTKRGKPAFDVVGDAVEDTRTGWVYRSETAPRAALPAAAPPRFNAAAPPEPKPKPKPAPEPVRAAQPSFGWIAGAMAMMSLPLVITAGIMIAPMALMWAARKSSNG